MVLKHKMTALFEASENTGAESEDPGPAQTGKTAVGKGKGKGKGKGRAVQG